jgi:hypothetical protein
MEMMAEPITDQKQHADPNLNQFSAYYRVQVAVEGSWIIHGKKSRKGKIKYYLCVDKYCVDSIYYRKLTILGGTR